MDREQIPFPDKLITWYDLAKGVGEVVLHAAFDLIHHEAKPTESEHYQPELTQVQKDANKWVDKMGFGND